MVHAVIYSASPSEAGKVGCWIVLDEVDYGMVGSWQTSFRACWNVCNLQSVAI